MNFNEIAEAWGLPTVPQTKSEAIEAIAARFGSQNLHRPEEWVWMGSNQVESFVRSEFFADAYERTIYQSDSEGYLFMHRPLERFWEHPGGHPDWGPRMHYTVDRQSWAVRGLSESQRRRLAEKILELSE